MLDKLGTAPVETKVAFRTGRKPLIDVMGGTLRHGRLTIVSEEPTPPSTHRKVRCVCDCGSEFVGYVTNIKRGKTTSCGCRQADLMRAAKTIHGDGAKSCRAPEYRAWAHMIGRCENPSDKSFHNYGARGIRVHPAWRADYSAFLADVGRRPTSRHTLDRHPNNDGNYEPGNVRWATAKQQMRNTRINRWIEFDGERLCLADTAAKYGLKRATLERRLRRGWPIGRALLHPVG